MSYTSGFFDAVDLGGGNYDRVYEAAQFAHYFSLLVGNGVFANPANSLQVMASDEPSMDIQVSGGSGWIKGYYITVDTEDTEILTVPIANPTLPRIDSIVIGWNNSDRKISPYVKQGTPSISPSPVDLQRDLEVYELELAQISIPAGLGAITQEQIKDMRQDANRCGIVSGLIEQFDATGLFAQYEAIFNSWFKSLETTLSGDVAGNLKLEIDKVMDYARSRPVVGLGIAKHGDWTDLPPYTNEVSIEGMEDGPLCDALIGPMYDDSDPSLRTVIRKAIISPISQQKGSITLVADGAKPPVDIPIVAFIFFKEGAD